MDKRITLYAPCTCMATLNFYFSRFPSAGEVTDLFCTVREWFKNSQTHIPDLCLHDLLLNWRSEKPVYQVFFAYHYKSDALFESLIEEIDRHAARYDPPFTLREIHITLSSVDC